jgi:hypothetical protein
MSRPQSDNVDVNLSEAVFDVRGPGFVAIGRQTDIGQNGQNDVRDP